MKQTLFSLIGGILLGSCVSSTPSGSIELAQSFQRTTLTQEIRTPITSRSRVYINNRSTIDHGNVDTFSFVDIAYNVGREVGILYEQQMYPYLGAPSRFGIDLFSSSEGLAFYTSGTIGNNPDFQIVFSPSYRLNIRNGLGIYVSAEILTLFENEYHNRSDVRTRIGLSLNNNTTLGLGVDAQNVGAGEKYYPTIFLMRRF